MNVQTLFHTRPVDLAKATVMHWMEDKALRLSAAIAYYSIFSLAPLLIIAIAIAGAFLGEDAVRGQLNEQLANYVGTQVSESLQTMIKGAAKGEHEWTATVIGFATMLLGASGVFGQLKDALNTIWEVKPRSGRGLWSIVCDYLLSFSMVLIIGFLLLVSLLLSTTVAALSHSIGHWIGISSLAGVILGTVASALVVTTLFAYIFKVLPDAEVRWRHVWVGAGVTALLFEIGKVALSYYLARESTASSFGAAGSVVLLLLWVYYSSCILLLGAEFTRVYAQAIGDNVPAMSHARPVTPEARAQQGLATVKSALR